MKGLHNGSAAIPRSDVPLCSHRVFGAPVVNEEQRHGSDEVRRRFGWRDSAVARDGAVGQGGARRWTRAIPAVVEAAGLLPRPPEPKAE